MSPWLFHSQVKLLLRVITNRWTRYVLLSLLGNGVLWGSVVLYLKTTKPTYTSEWSLILPGASFGVNVNLPGIGQAVASNGSGMGSSTYDPRANYEFIFASETVLARAAVLAKIPAEKFSKPRIKLLDNTTIMMFEVTGGDPKQAQQKSYALYRAIVERLNTLRAEEIQQRELPNQKILLAAQKKLERAQSRLSAYKLQSGLSSPDQVSNLTSNIEQLRRLRSETRGQRELLTNRLQQLSRNLGVTPQMAADAFVLQTDQIFQKNLKDYSEATAALEVLLSKFGPNHPQVVKEQRRKESTYQALRARSVSLLGNRATPSFLSRMFLASNGTGRDTLFQTLVTYQADQQGLIGQVRALDTEIYRLEARLKLLSHRQSTLENLKRDEQVAEAIFTSTLTKLDLGQGDIFSAYPLAQMAVEPSIPATPTAPKKGLVLAGAGLGSVFSTMGLWILWIRKPWIKKISKFISS
jgi:uncharacterized protein involved in exopolysaccharide biosynthesis